MLPYPAYSPDFSSMRFLIIHSKKNASWAKILHCKRGRRNNFAIIFRPCNIRFLNVLKANSVEYISATWVGYFEKL